MINVYNAKDPDDTDDFTLNWDEELAAGETISTATWAVIVGTLLTVASSSNTTTTATARLAGGTAGEMAEVRCRIITSAGRQLDETLRIPVDSQ
jgi:hypothetical protein